MKPEKNKLSGITEELGKLKKKAAGECADRYLQGFQNLEFQSPTQVILPNEVYERS